MTDSIFQLSERRAHKAAPSLISADERHFRSIATTLSETAADLATRLDATRRQTGRLGQEAMERDFEVHRLSDRLRMFRRFGADLCLGSMTEADTGHTVYIGRLGLMDDEGGLLLVDWRSPAAEPFFGATRADPMGLVRRRRYRWDGGVVTDYWDEVFGLVDLENTASLDDESAFVARLGADRSDRMRDVLGTIAADQDAVIRAGAGGALVVDGGPGTGKTVVALHRTAYLIYRNPALGRDRGGVLFVGPHDPYLAYVSDVLPNLGEDGVQLCTVRDLVAEGSTVVPEVDPTVARIKASADVLSIVDAAVRFYEQPPTSPTVVETDWEDLALTPADWADAFASPEPGTPHNHAREQISTFLTDLLTSRASADSPPADVRRQIAESDHLRRTLNNAWTLIDAADLVRDLWSVPAYLALCAPNWSAAERESVRRSEGAGWTAEDLPFLDIARARLGDPEHGRHARRRAAALAAERSRMDRVIDDLLASDDDEKMAAQLRQDAIRDALVDPAGLPTTAIDPLAGPFSHIVVDEAQELTDAQWQMLLNRCPLGSFTIVGDRAQARHGFLESWEQRLMRVGVRGVEVRGLNVNYRTPQEIMTVAEPVIRAQIPDANVPMSIRSNGIPVTYGSVSEVERIVDEWLADHADGTVCVIGDPTFESGARVRSSTPDTVKGLEFDLVVLVDPDAFGSGVEGAVGRYVAMTRATSQLVVLGDCPNRAR